MQPLAPYAMARPFFDFYLSVLCPGLLLFLHLSAYTGLLGVADHHAEWCFAQVHMCVSCTDGVTAKLLAFCGAAPSPCRWAIPARLSPTPKGADCHPTWAGLGGSFRIVAMIVARNRFCNS